LPNVKQQIDDLIGLEPIKTWSLIISLFGDFDGVQLSGKAIRSVLDQIGIKPEATRVALHRLKHDGWINSIKNGREVTYVLSEHGLAETDAVYKDIYRQDIKYPDGWQLVLTEQENAAVFENHDAIRLFRHVFLLPKQVRFPAELGVEVVPKLEPLPEWFANRLVPDEIAIVAKGLSDIADQIEIKNVAIDHIYVSAIRLLLLHRWRKMALRSSTWAHISIFPNGAMASCHKKVTRLLNELPKPKLD